jgi:hypothetical protein
MTGAVCVRGLLLHEYGVEGALVRLARRDRATPAHGAVVAARATFPLARRGRDFFVMGSQPFRILCRYLRARFLLQQVLRRYFGPK